jgi:hypothetical protein
MDKPSSVYRRRYVALVLQRAYARRIKDRGVVAAIEPYIRLSADDGAQPVERRAALA